MKDPRLASAIVKWIADRCPDLLDLVFPFDASPPSVPPYCTYAFVDRVPETSFGGLSGLTMRRVQLDVWDTDDARGSSLAMKIQGTRDDPGLDQMRDVLPFDEVGDYDAGELTIEHCKAENPSESFEPPADASEVGWRRYSCDYLFTYIEG